MNMGTVIKVAANADLNKARVGKNDEFYTQLSDIECEMVYYKDYFKDKVVYCNCDNPIMSNFWRYFHWHFEELGLKELLSTHYDTVDKTYLMSYSGGNDSNELEGNIKELEGNGDFRNEECIEILKMADIVATNPPFSLFREFLAQLIEYGKKFIILGNMNALTYKEVFPLFRDNKVWYGPSISSGDRKFTVPDDYELNAAGCGIDGDGKKYIRVKGVRWFTNIDHTKRHEPLKLLAQFCVTTYQKYDGYDAIEVSRVADIPCDYFGEIGVPITFMDKYCAEQFEIIGLDRYTVPKEYLVGGRVAIKGKPCYARILIKRKDVN